MTSRLTAYAKSLRARMTDAERRLWQRLGAGRLGARFRRQQPIGPYIVDFVCFEHRLVIELDGGQHAETAVYDAARTGWLESQGFRVLRFWNNEVMNNTEGVLSRIMEAMSPSPRPSPTRGEGA